MNTIYLDNEELTVYGNLPEIGEQAPPFILTDENFNEVILDDFKNEPLLINIYPSIDTTICFNSVINFNNKLKHKKMNIICVSMDLPFAIKRIHQAGTLDKVKILSDFRNREFGHLYGVTIANGPLAGLLARAIIILNSNHKVIYRELVRNIASPPDYKKALDTLYIQ
jgi:thiol peroxidase